VAHDCALGSRIVIANNVMLAGHVSVGDQAFLSGAAGVHQFCRIGRLAMVGGQAHLSKDVPPFVTIDGATTTVVGLNLVGLRRAGLTREDIGQLKAAYRIIYRSGLPWLEVLRQLQESFNTGPAAEFHAFFSSGRRGFTPQRRPGHALRLHDQAEDDEGKPLRAAA
jgi:UDP-N-acetylglucosamine acyltransferase